MQTIHWAKCSFEKRTIVEGFEVANEFDIFIDRRFFGVDGPSQHMAAELHVIFCCRVKTIVIKQNMLSSWNNSIYKQYFSNSNIFISNEQKHFKRINCFCLFFLHTWAETVSVTTFLEEGKMSECSEQQHSVATETLKEEMNPWGGGGQNKKTKQKVE